MPATNTAHRPRNQRVAGMPSVGGCWSWPSPQIALSATLPPSRTRSMTIKQDHHARPGSARWQSTAAAVSSVLFGPLIGLAHVRPTARDIEPETLLDQNDGEQRKQVEDRKAEQIARQPVALGPCDAGRPARPAQETQRRARRRPESEPPAMPTTQGSRVTGTSSSE